MQWVPSREGENPWAAPWVSKSSDGYYAIAYRITDDEFEAYHIEALWARPTNIGNARTLGDAKTICEQHLTTQGTPT